jgi:hypothetical protein
MSSIGDVVHKELEGMYNLGHSHGWINGWKAHDEAVHEAYKAGVITEEQYDTINEFINKQEAA